MTIKDFNSFLRSEGVYENFYRYLSEFLGEEWLSETLRTKPASVISCSFSWEKTPQGHAFWWSIKDLWKKYIKEHSDKDIKRKHMTIETLYNFMRKNDCLVQFFYNMATASIKKDATWLKEAWKCNPEQIINRAFSWRETPEGNSFWTETHHKWVDEYKKLQKEEHDIPTYSYKEKKVIDCIVKSEVTLSTTDVNKIKDFIVEKYPQVKNFTTTMSSVTGWHYVESIEEE